MKRRLAYLLRFYVLTVAVFLVAKVLFLVSQRAAHPFSAADVADVLLHGLSLDLSTALYFLALPFLLTIAAVWRSVPRRVFLIYYGVVALAFSLAFVADVSLYPFWQFKLDASCLQYLATPADAMASVSTAYLVVRVLLVAVVAAVLFAVFRGLPAPSHRRTPASGKTPSPSHRPTKAKLAETAFYVLCMPLMVIGIRGGLGESTTNIGQVYYSQQQFLNHAAVNPVFSFLSSLGKSGSNVERYDYFAEAECRRLTDSLFYTDSTRPDTLLTTRRPNIVIVLMESCGAQFTAVGGHPEITPRLNQLAREGVSFTQCYANSWRTDKGVVSALSGYPAFPVTSVMKIPEKSHKLPSIASALSAEGYQSSFFYGGDINFTNMRSYVMGTGYSRLRWKSDYPSHWQRTAQWGVRDDLMFSALLSDIRREPAGGRWMKTLLTLSSHEPWDVPTRVLDDPVYNAFHYLDHSLGLFIDSLRQTPQWRDLLVVVMPDHGYRYRGIDETTRLYNHIPMLWLGGAVRRPCVLSRLCNQSDLAATLLGQMGIGHRQFAFSRDVASQGYCRPMAWHTFNNGMTLYDSLGFTAYDLDAQHVVAHEGGDAARRLRVARALLQLTSHDLAGK